MITFSDIKNNADIRTYIVKADESLRALGYTEHSFAHVTKVADTASYLLKQLGFSERECELAMIAGYLHDIGNLINRSDHSQSGAVMAFRILDNLGMSASELSEIVTAIGNHDEGTGVAVNPISAALIIADKSDVRRSRVRNSDISSFDIHDRVNYSVKNAVISLNTETHEIKLTLDIDTSISSVMEYFEIFLGRMSMCKNAAKALGLNFRLCINGQMLL